MSTLEARHSEGKRLREVVPRSSHAEFLRRSDVDPVATLLSQDEDRIPNLVPVRHDRMNESPYAFYRAGAKLMATDLATTPTTNLIVQASGDAHLANFGWYGSPERQLVFDAYDVGRMKTFASACAWTLAQSHARSGDPVAVAGYIGSGHAFPEALAAFAVAYETQNAADYEAFAARVGSGTSL